uniref:Saposin B-type domain-containing protein n=1 Tax=Arcella intermedia TaxID=1963864 RepID=A0A6B2LEE3_9EUKA
MLETGWNRSCSKLSITRPYCEQPDFVDSLVSVSHLLTQNMQPRDVCEAVSVCEPKVSLTVDAAMDYSCSLCRSIITFAKQQYLLNPDLNALLGSLCQQVPTNLLDKCNAMTNSSLLSYSLSTNMDAATTCKLSECYPGPEAKHLNSPKVTPKARLSSAAFVVTCQGCQWALSAIESYLSQESTEAELGGVLSELCTILPDPYAKICQNLVTVYLSEGVIFVLDILTPPYICSKLNVCDFS